ncbi:MAG: hypothetical protein ACXVI6_00155 [Candidatus Aminicenantales bacterium]
MKTRTYCKSCMVVALAISALLVMPGVVGARTGDEVRAQAAGAPQTQPAAKPAAAEPSPVLTARDKELLAEALRLKQILGDEVWPGLGSAAIPVIIYNERYEFLTGPVNPLPQPPWVRVEKDDFSGQPYYRRPAQNPQAFAVDLGKQWAGSMTSLEAMNRRPRFKFSADFYVVLLLHEVFHAFQATVAPARFREANAVYALEKTYPVKDPAFAKAWTEEGALLAAALKAKDPGETMDKVRAFLRQRDSRREPLQSGIMAANYERQLEWLEGLAKYAEIRFYELAAARSQEPAFAAYKPGLSYWTWDFVRLDKQLGTQEGDLRFYVSGMAQARILDRLSPGWKADFFKEGRSMEELLISNLGTQY